jgi:hypothetical protein
MFVFIVAVSPVGLRRQITFGQPDRELLVRDDFRDLDKSRAFGNLLPWSIVLYIG